VVVVVQAVAVMKIAKIFIIAGEITVGQMFVRVTTV